MEWNSQRTRRVLNFGAEVSKDPSFVFESEEEHRLLQTLENLDRSLSRVYPDWWFSLTDEDRSTAELLVNQIDWEDQTLEEARDLVARFRADLAILETSEEELMATDDSIALIASSSLTPAFIWDPDRKDWDEEYTKAFLKFMEVKKEEKSQRALRFRDLAKICQLSKRGDPVRSYASGTLRKAMWIKEFGLPAVEAVFLDPKAMAAGGIEAQIRAKSIILKAEEKDTAFLEVAKDVKAIKLAEDKKPEKKKKKKDKKEKKWEKKKKNADRSDPTPPKGA